MANGGKQSACLVSALLQVKLHKKNGNCRETISGSSFFRLSSKTPLTLLEKEV